MPEVRHISYLEAQRLAVILGSKLRENDSDSLKKAAFTAIPRGGLIVLGMLSYVLKLDRRQLSPQPSAEVPLVVVDDCLLSGARTHALLKDIPNSEIILVHLFSAEVARRAVMDQEPRVKLCLAAEDLAVWRESTEQQRDLWAEQFPMDAYWRGFLRPLHFAWSEPDNVIWNGREERLEHNWHRAGPADCLECLIDLDLPFIDSPKREIRLADDILWRKTSTGFRIWNGQTDEVYELEGSAADLWRACLGFGARRQAIAYVNQLYSDAPRAAGLEMENFVDQLFENGLLKRSAQSEE